MRTIKFRGLKKSDGKMITGDLNHIDNGVFIFNRDEFGDNMNSLDDYEVHPETVGQFTGLKDKNSVEIYEGDTFELLSGDVAEIKHSIDYYQGFICKELKSNWYWNLRSIKGKVIGNIHDKN